MSTDGDSFDDRRPDLSVFLSVIFFGIREQGVKGYFREYLQPVAFMLPLHVISEISRTIVSCQFDCLAT